MKRFFIGLMILGFVILFGTAGASDVGNITLYQVCMQAIASVIFLFTGMLGLKVCHMQKMRARHTHRVQKTPTHSAGLRTYVFNGGRKVKKVA